MSIKRDAERRRRIQTKTLISHYNGVRESTKEEIKRKEEMKDKDVCEILKEHHNDLKNDPEHLHTEFLENLIGVSCQCQDRDFVINALSRIRFV